MVCAKIPEILAAMTKSCMSPTRDPQGLRRIGKYRLPDPQGVHGGADGPVRQGLQDFQDWIRRK